MSTETLKINKTELRFKLLDYTFSYESHFLPLNKSLTKRRLYFYRFQKSHNVVS